MAVGVQVKVLLPDVAGLPAAFEDEQELRDAYWHPQPGDVVLDIGAGVGSYTIPALMAGAEVIAVDPDKQATGKLELVAQVNGLPGLTVRNCGVWEAGAYPPEMHQALASSEYSYLIPPPGTEFVTFDELARPLTRLDWVKIDVEGAELGVLRSGRQSIERLHPRFLIELHDEVYPFVAQMGSAGQCSELLTGLGYTIREVPYGPPPRTYLVTE